MNFLEQIEWKKKISEWARELGFLTVGFTTAEPIHDLSPMLQDRRDQALATPFESKDIQQRVDPQVVWPDCQTVVALAYPLPFTVSPQAGEGVIARSAVGEDYHRVINRKMQQLMGMMFNNNWTGSCRIQVDTGPLVERAFAARAGIGWIGRNQHLIIPGFGTFAALALLLLDQEIAPNDPLISGNCGSCHKCVEACPAKVIGHDPFEAKKCVSYLTQSKEVLTSEEISCLGVQIFGCDVCQEVCPHNQKWLKAERDSSCAEDFKDLDASSLRRGVDLLKTLNLTKGEFGNQFKLSAAGWRGKGVLQRNAFLALCNTYKTDPTQWLKGRAKDRPVPPMILPYLE